MKSKHEQTEDLIKAIGQGYKEMTRLAVAGVIGFILLLAGLGYLAYILFV